MPLYEYHCFECGKQSELLIRSESEQALCPECDSPNMKRLLSVPAAHTGGRSAAGAQDLPLAPPQGPCGSSCGCFPEG